MMKIREKRKCIEMFSASMYYIYDPPRLTLLTNNTHITINLSNSEYYLCYWERDV